MHDGMPYGRNQGQGQGHSREVDRQSPTGLIFLLLVKVMSVVTAALVEVCTLIAPVINCICVSIHVPVNSVRNCLSGI